MFLYSHLITVNKTITHTDPCFDISGVLFQSAGKPSYSSYWNQSVLASMSESFSSSIYKRITVIILAYIPKIFAAISEWDMPTP